LTTALVGTASGNQIAALSAFEGNSALPAVQVGGSISPRWCSAQSAVRGLAGLLPDWPAAPGEPVTVIERAARDEDEDFPEFRVTRRERFTPTAEFLVAEVLRRPRTGAGYFVVGARDRRGAGGARFNAAVSGGFTIDEDAGGALIRWMKEYPAAWTKSCRRPNGSSRSHPWERHPPLRSTSLPRLRRR